MTRQILAAWAKLIRRAIREGWPAERLDAALAEVRT